MIFTALTFLGLLHGLFFRMRTQCQLDYMNMFKVPILNKSKKEKDNTKKWKGFSVSLNRFELDYVSYLKIIDKLVFKLLMYLRVSQEYGVLQLSYQTFRYFNSASQVAKHFMSSDWAHVQGSSVVQREEHEHDVKKKHQEP